MGFIEMYRRRPRVAPLSTPNFTNNLFPLAPLADGSVPTGDFYRPRSGKKPLVPKYGNSLSVLPAGPVFFEVRDAIIVMDQELTGGENFCTLWRGFSFKVLGPDANIALRTLWDGGVRTDDFEVPLACDSY
ncbi:hypothetical protein B0H14DRAFT_3509976 [Mycena olivaceomarginata]|nr:hypothetical protein B0H14DRAFT_3509976 [Mycena olivaceomarginata]